MPEFITKITRIRFDKSAMRILWAEAVLFSVLFGLIFHSWPIAVILFSVLFAFLYSPSRAIYAVFILSFLWGFIIAGTAFELGWVWSVALGGIVFYKGIKLHLHDLKFLSDEPGLARNEWRQNWRFGRQNLN